MNVRARETARSHSSPVSEIVPLRKDERARAAEQIERDKRERESEEDLYANVACTD